MNVAVIGAGSWGTTLAGVLAKNGHDTRLWALEKDVVHEINADHENRRFLPGARLPESLRATTDLEIALAGAEVLVSVVPSQ
jgi:glycerol-3-phosphate dehydrogenase (NAD(P)+)